MEYLEPHNIVEITNICGYILYNTNILQTAQDIEYHLWLNAMNAMNDLLHIEMYYQSLDKNHYNDIVLKLSFWPKDLHLHEHKSPPISGIKRLQNKLISLRYVYTMNDDVTVKSRVLCSWTAVYFWLDHPCFIQSQNFWLITFFRKMNGPKQGT